MAVAAAALPGFVLVAPRLADAPWNDGFPPAVHVKDHLSAYELPVRRPVTVDAVRTATEHSRSEIDTSDGTWWADTVVSATGSWGRPFWPYYPGCDTFEGVQLHAVHYAGPEPFRGRITSDLSVHT